MDSKTSRKPRKSRKMCLCRRAIRAELTNAKLKSQNQFYRTSDDRSEVPHVINIPWNRCIVMSRVVGSCNIATVLYCVYISYFSYISCFTNLNYLLVFVPQSNFDFHPNTTLVIVHSNCCHTTSISLDQYC